MKFSIASALALALTASAKVIKVQVADSGFDFNPANVKAAVGDQIAFVFNGNGHTVGQGVFGNACQPASSNPFFSGTANGGQTWTITVANTNPTPFYCTPHCQLGMVGVINPTAAKSVAKYKKAAKAASSSSPAPSANGGTFS